MILIVEKQVNAFTVQKQTVLKVRILEFNLPSGIQNTVFTAKGQIIVGSGNGTYQIFGPEDNGKYIVFDSSSPLGLKAEIPTINVSDTTNHLVNGGWDYAQEQTPGTLTTIAEGSYGGDQWKTSRENADLQFRRVDASAESLLHSPYYGEYTKITNAGKFLVIQPLEYLDTLKFRGQTVGFQLQMKSNVARTMRIAILELQAAGVADILPTLVSLWNADATDPTFGANLATISTPVSCPVTTAWQVFQFTGTFPSASKNLLVAIWSDADVAVNGTVSMAEAGLYFGSSVRSWTPKSKLLEIDAIRRYVFKTFPLDTAPAQNTGNVGALRFIAGKAGATLQYGSFRTSMRVSPTITTYNPSAANAQARDTTAAVDCSSTVPSGVNSADLIGINTTGNASTAVGNLLDVHVLAKAQL